jgi:hypothetical protein
MFDPRMEIVAKMMRLIEKCYHAANQTTIIELTETQIEAH